MINWLDVLLLAIVFYSAVAGFRRGLVRQFFDVAGILVSYYVALRYSRAFVTWLSLFVPIDRWLPEWFGTTLPGGFVLGDVLVWIAGFMLLFFAARMLAMALGSVLHGIFSLPLLGTVNCLGGLTLGLLKGILLTVMLVAVLKLLGTPFWLKTLEESVVAGMVTDILPLVYNQMLDFLLKDLAGAV